ncbi:helix-turn-helix domain-containing protein [Seohaeicola nanhaiensis]|uniref:Helix-turn-helix domain-containing protein n=1 Tax=Seohaeicola nanhaiensis TaxID=1387282 RepID=A0ABV9KIW9_9RHOB
MPLRVDKRERATNFRTRLQQALQQSGTTQSGLARAVGVDRSTISQLLTDDGARLPNGHLVGACASALGVSSDWLLSLSDRRESAAELLAGSLSLTEAPRALIDERIFAWHKEAAGYKIRHVPAALPDMLKTHAILEWEYRPHLGRTTDQAIGASEDRLQWMRSAGSDYEIAMPITEMASFAEASGYYEGLPADLRRAQLQHLLDLCDQLYPRLRLYLFDSRRIYSAPITIFGPLLCVFYAGGHYLAFRDRNRIASFTGHFDRLVRETEMAARDIPAYLRRLLAAIG